MINCSGRGHLKYVASFNYMCVCMTHVDPFPSNCAGLGMSTHTSPVCPTSTSLHNGK